jgi:hypothetical protein
MKAGTVPNDAVLHRNRAPGVPSVVKEPEVAGSGRQLHRACPIETLLLHGVFCGFDRAGSHDLPRRFRFKDCRLAS